jgi:hypothetical protein
VFFVVVLLLVPLVFLLENMIPLLAHPVQETPMDNTTQALPTNTQTAKHAKRPRGPAHLATIVPAVTGN